MLCRSDTVGSSTAGIERDFGMMRTEFRTAIMLRLWPKKKPNRLKINTDFGGT
jgi:hypothetical protein